MPKIDTSTSISCVKFFNVLNTKVSPVEKYKIRGNISIFRVPTTIKSKKKHTFEARIDK